MQGAIRAERACNQTRIAPRAVLRRREQTRFFVCERRGSRRDPRRDPRRASLPSEAINIA